MHLTKHCPSPVDFKRTASRTLISVFESTSASDKPWTVDGMNWFLKKVEFSNWTLLNYFLHCVGEFSIFSNGDHLGYREISLMTILKWDYTMTVLPNICPNCPLVSEMILIIFFTIRYMLENLKARQNKILQHFTNDL